MPEIETDKPIQIKEYRIYKAVAISLGIVIILILLSAWKFNFNINIAYLLFSCGIGLTIGYFLFNKKKAMNYLEVVKIIRKKYQEVININDYEVERITQSIWVVYFPREAYSIVWDSFTNEFWKVNKTLSQVKIEYKGTKEESQKTEERRRGRLKELGIERKEDLE